MKRTNVYLSEKQLERLRIRAQREGVAIAELVRRATDAFLAWDDPTYTPPIPSPKEGTLIHPLDKSQRLSGPTSEFPYFIS